MLTVSVTTLRTGPLELPAPETAGDGDASRAGDTADCARSGTGAGGGVTCTGTGALAGAGGGVLGLFREGAAFGSGAGTTLLMTLLTKEKKKVKTRQLNPNIYFKTSENNFFQQQLLFGRVRRCSRAQGSSAARINCNLFRVTAGEGQRVAGGSQLLGGRQQPRPLSR